MSPYKRVWFGFPFFFFLNRCIGHGQPNPREGEIFPLCAKLHPSVSTTYRRGVGYKDLNDKAEIGLQVGLCPGILLS